MRRSFALLLLVVACGAGTKEAPPKPPEPAPIPAVTASAAPAVEAHAEPVLVVLVVDQFAAWIASDRVQALPDDGGFARLRRDGLYVRELRYQHATTSTAPGHAALFTGLPPRDSRVFANDAFDPVTKAPATILEDPVTHVVGGDANEARKPSSSAGVLGPVKTLADALREQRPDAEILTMSMKDRGAIFAAGKRPDAALWFDDESGGFVTSSAFAQALPAWVRAFNQGMAKYWSQPWTRLDRAWVESHAATPDLQPGERDLPGLGVTFDHAIDRAEKPRALLHLTPFADAALLDLAVAGLDATPSGKTRYLAVSLSPFDYIGHTFGPDSHESWDELYRLDATLKAFFTELDRRFPKGYSVMLSADHGAPPLPETAMIPRARPWCDHPAEDRFQRPCGSSGRVAAKSLQDLATAVAKKAKRPDAVLGLAGPLLFLTPDSRFWPKEERASLLLAIKRAISKVPEVAEVFETSALPAACPPGGDESLVALVCRSVVPGSGDLYIVLKPGSFFDVGNGRGVNHSSPYLYDRSVPLFVMTGDKRRAGQVLETPVSPADFNRTAAALLEIAPPPGGEPGRDLSRP